MITSPTLPHPAVTSRWTTAPGLGASRDGVRHSSPRSRLRLFAVLLVLVGVIALDGAYVPAVGWATLLAAVSAAAATFAAPRSPQESSSCRARRESASASAALGCCSPPPRSP
ncbi:hypothetical protein ACFQ51_38295 [Streptomyces kaempferi]